MAKPEIIKYAGEKTNKAFAEFLRKASIQNADAYIVGVVVFNETAWAEVYQNLSKGMMASRKSTYWRRGVEREFPKHLQYAYQNDAYSGDR